MKASSFSIGRTRHLKEGINRLAEKIVERGEKPRGKQFHRQGKGEMAWARSLVEDLGAAALSKEKGRGSLEKPQPYCSDRKESQDQARQG